MVNGPSPDPAPAAQARDSSSRPTRSSWRTCPHRKLRRNVPRVDGALTTQPSAPAVPPVRNASASSMQSPPARPCHRKCGGGHQGQHLVSRVRPPLRISEVNVVVDELTQTQVLGEGDRKEQPSIVHQAVVVKGDLDVVGVVAW